MIEPIILIWTSGTLFAVIHSLLAQNKCKQCLYPVGISQQGYRLGYVVFAILTTILWLAFVHSLADTTLYYIENSIAWWLLSGIQLLGISLFWASLRPIDVDLFLGLRKCPDEIEPFIEKGVYCYIRHPMYLATMLIMFAMPEQSVNSINLYAMITLYFIIGSKLEEKRLTLAHPEYKDYCHRVAAFIPLRHLLNKPIR